MCMCVSVWSVCIEVFQGWDIHETISEQQLPRLRTAHRPTCQPVTDQCTGCVSANTRPHQLRWSDHATCHAHSIQMAGLTCTCTRVHVPSGHTLYVHVYTRTIGGPQAVSGTTYSTAQMQSITNARSPKRVCAFNKTRLSGPNERVRTM